MIMPAVRNASDLVRHIQGAVDSHGATPNTEIFIRIGPDGPMYNIADVKGFKDVRGFALILEGGALLGLSS
jgi:hypothetical protein